MTVADVARLYRISRQRVHELAKDRGIHGQRLGPILTFTPDQVRALKPGAHGRHRKDKRQ